MIDYKINLAIKILIINYLTFPLTVDLLSIRLSSIRLSSISLSSIGLK